MHATRFLAASTLALTLAVPALACERPKSPRLANELKQFGVAPHVTPRPSADMDVPLRDDLGPLSFRITTDNRLAQRYFDQGLMLAYGFNHAEARRNFQAAQRLDPTCALCFWGEALVLGPNINAPMDPAVNAAALAAVRQAQGLASRASPREQALIRALAARYSDDPKAERPELDRAYADAMVAAARSFPSDHDIAVLAAESLMDLSPWDYWEPGGARGKGRTDELVALLEGVLAANPHHPGAIHLYIHAVEASDRPERAEPYADRLAGQGLGAGHLVHMPSHIYYRLGRYKDSLEANRKAAAVDEAFFEQVKRDGIYGGGYYPHNLHFLMVSAQMAGDGPSVLAAAAKLHQIVSDDAARTFAWVQPIKAAPFFAHAQFSTPDVILGLPKPSGNFGYVNAMWHYARGIAQVARGDLEAARAEAEAIASLKQQADVAELVAGGVPAPDLLELARQVVLGRIAQAEGNTAGAVAAFESAAAIEAGLSYMEPPFWYYPVAQSLGATLLRAGQPDRAEAVFRNGLRKSSNNGWLLFGLTESLKAQGKAGEAEAVARQLDAAWAGDRSLLDLRMM